jgi:(S)-ureidoglycine aminohydrolase
MTGRLNNPLSPGRTRPGVIGTKHPPAGTPGAKYQMRTPDQLVHSRAKLRDRFALFPLEGFPASRIPTWDKTEARVLASPAIGAGFSMYLLDVAAGGGNTHAADSRVETFLYVNTGSATLSINGQRPAELTPGGFALLPPNTSYDLKVNTPTNLIALRKAYEPLSPGKTFNPVIGNQSAIPALPWMNNEHSRLQTLIPDELQFDLAMNIFTFDPGYGLPYVETHVMEHGLLFLQGKGIYYLDDAWMEVEQNDFIWMGPYCPQSFYATGPMPARYIYYKNVNREIPL